MKIRKGFTLMEMLVVIVTLGILSAVMMFSSLEAVSSVDANNIINNMQQIKVAVYAWYKDNRSRIIPDKSAGYKIRTNGTNQYFSEFVRDHKDEILQYLDNSGSINLISKKESSNETGDYLLTAVEKTKKWYICYNTAKLNNGTKDETIDKYGTEAPELKVREKLAGRAKTLGLAGMTKKDDDEMAAEVYSGQKFVCMLILELP